MTVSVPIEVPAVRGRLTLHPRYILAAFHQDGRKVILVKHDKRSPRSFTKKLVGGPGSITAFRSGAALGVQSRSSTAFFDVYGNPVGSVQTGELRFPVELASAHGSWGFKGSTIAHLSTAQVLQQVCILHVPITGLEPLPDGDCIAHAQRGAAPQSWVVRRDGSTTALGGMGRPVGDAIALVSADGPVRYIDTHGQTVACPANPTRLLLTAEGAATYEVRDETVPRPSTLVLSEIRPDQDSRAVSVRRLVVEDGPLLAWTLVEDRIAWATPRHVHFAKVANLDFR